MTGGVDEAGLFVVGLIVEFVVFADGDVCVETAEVDEVGLVVVELVVEFVVFADGDVCVVTAEVDAAGLAVVELVLGGEDSFAALVEVIVVLVVVGVVLVEDEVFVEEVVCRSYF